MERERRDGGAAAAREEGGLPDAEAQRSDSCNTWTLGRRKRRRSSAGKLPPWPPQARLATRGRHRLFAALRFLHRSSPPQEGLHHDAMARFPIFNLSNFSGERHLIDALDRVTVPRTGELPFRRSLRYRFADRCDIVSLTSVIPFLKAHRFPSRTAPDG